MLCIVVLSLTSLSLFKDLTNLNTFIGVVYFVVFFDIIAIIARFTNRAFIEPYQLDIFPISKWRKFLFHFTILLLDYKSLIYLSAVVFFIIMFINDSLYAVAGFIFCFGFFLFRY